MGGFAGQVVAAFMSAILFLTNRLSTPACL